MYSSVADVLAASADPSLSAPLQALDPSVFLDAPAPLRAVAVFLLTVVFGGVVIYRYGGRLDAAVEASMAHPLSSVIYGVIAYGLVGFFFVYGYTQLLRVGAGNTLLTGVAAAVLVAFLFSLGGLGFVVVGTWVTDLLGARNPWTGLVGVGLASALAMLVLPGVVGLLLWFVIAAVGTGGPTRRWMHADAVDNRTE